MLNSNQVNQSEIATQVVDTVETIGAPLKDSVIKPNEIANAGLIMGCTAIALVGIAIARGLNWKRLTPNTFTRLAEKNLEKPIRFR